MLGKDFSLKIRCHIFDILFHFEKKFIYILPLNGPHNINYSQLSLSPHYIPGTVLSDFYMDYLR